MTSDNYWKGVFDHRNALLITETYGCRDPFAASVNTSAVLSDERFDFSDAYVLSVGCAGTAEGYGILGDVFVISAAVDFDLGHHADPREMQDGTGTTWFHDEGFDDIAFLEMDRALTDRVYERIGGVRLETTERTARFLNREYPGEAWGKRRISEEGLGSGRGV